MIVTFYSFKGGVGRSMALANVAEIFASNGLDVIACDWDLEAPGLERYFAADQRLAKEYERRAGIIDLLLEFRRSASTSSRDSLPYALTGSKDEFRELGSLRLRRPSTLAFDVGLKRQVRGRLRLLTAGRRDADVYGKYLNAIQTFDWREFYSKWAGGGPISNSSDRIWKPAVMLF